MFSLCCLRKRIFLLCLLFPLLSAASPQRTTPWQVSANAYLWALNMRGSMQIGDNVSQVSDTFSDILHQFHSGGMLWVDAQKARFGLFFNGMFSVLKDSQLAGGQTVKTTSTFSLVALGASYQLLNQAMGGSPNARFIITPYAGVRYTLNALDLTVAGTSFENSEHWYQPLIGSRFTAHFNQRWQVELAGDIAGTNASLNGAYNLVGLLGYQHLFGMKNAILYVGYRFFKQCYKKGRGASTFRWDMKLFGPIAGVSFVF
jgi:hypothetical protein